MKKIFLISALIFCLFGQQTNVAHAANQSYYAKVENSGTFLYSTQSESSAMFEIPTSYFVKTESFGDVFYKVSYNNISGFIKKSNVSLMNGTPQTPYAQATFKLFVANYMYTNTSQNSSVVCSVNTTDILNYIGKKDGEQVNSSSNVWYYCKLAKDGQEYYGYVFSGITDYLSSIPLNTESFERINENTLTDDKQSLPALSSKTKIMLIISISIPSAMILYFLIRPSKIIQITANKRQIKQAKRQRRHGDYFEFDESDL